MADEERRLVSGAQREILNDFLSFVEKNFPRLGPFNTLSRCAAEPSRVRRRLYSIVSEVLRTDGRTVPGIHTSVITAYLEYDVDRKVKLLMFPADTLQQARVFFDLPNIIERSFMLVQKGWTIRPNFHFGFMAKGFGWTTTTATLAEYLEYWQQNIRNTAQIERQEWNAYWNELWKAKIAEPADRDQFDHDFTNTDRQFAALDQDSSVRLLGTLTRPNAWTPGGN